MIQNITIRVPWTDNGWCGKVCNKPCENMACLLPVTVPYKRF